MTIKSTGKKTLSLLLTLCLALTLTAGLGLSAAADEIALEETPAAETSAEELPALELITEEPPLEGAPTEELPSEELPAEEVAPPVSNSGSNVIAVSFDGGTSYTGYDTFEEGWNLAMGDRNTNLDDGQTIVRLLRNWVAPAGGSMGSGTGVFNAGPIWVRKSVILNLNGWTIDRGLTEAQSMGCVFLIQRPLAIRDTATGGTIKGGYDNIDYYVRDKVGGTDHVVERAPCFATVSDVTVNGAVGSNVTSGELMLTLTGTSFNSVPAGTDVTNYFRSLPAGLSAAVKSDVADGARPAPQKRNLSETQNKARLTICQPGLGLPQKVRTDILDAGLDLLRPE